MSKPKKAKQKVHGTIQAGGDNDLRKSTFEALNKEAHEEADGEH